MAALAGSPRCPTPLHSPPKLHVLDAARADLHRLFLGKDLATKTGFCSHQCLSWGNPHEVSSCDVLRHKLVLFSWLTDHCFASLFTLLSSSTPGYLNPSPLLLASWVKLQHQDLFLSIMGMPKRQQLCSGFCSRISDL